MLHSQSLRGLQKIAARCGLLPKSYLIPRESLPGVNGTSSTTERVSITRECSIKGVSVAVKTISPDRIENFDAFKRVSSLRSEKPLVDVVLCLGSYRGYAPILSCGSNYGIQTWSTSLGSTPTLLLYSWYTLG